MRKKEIEKIPYLTLPQRNESKKVKYIGRTVLKDIGGKCHIMLEVYENEKDSRNVPVIRYVASKTEWGVYFPDKSVWTEQRIRRGDYGWGQIWQTKPLDVREKDCGKVHVLYSEDDLKRIKNYFKGIDVYRESEWWEYFEKNEDNIRYQKKKRMYELREERLKDRIANTPELPEQEILNWAEKEVFAGKHYLYYKKKGRYATICCSKCGGVYDGKWKKGEGYLSQFESLIEEPVNRRMGRCKLCGEYGIYKAQGLAGIIGHEEGYVFTADKYKEKGVVIRYIQLGHTWHLEEMCGDDGKPEMHGAYEKYEGVEIARAYIVPGEKTQIDFRKYSPWEGENVWADCNLSGMNNIQIHAGKIYPRFYENVKGTLLQYSGIEYYATAVEMVNAIDYANTYKRMPQIEMLVKMGLFGITEEIVDGRTLLVKNEKAKNPADFFGINKSHVKKLIEEDDITYLRVLQWERRWNACWNDAQVKKIAAVIENFEGLRIALQYMSVQQLLNRIEKYAGVKISEKQCSRARENLRHIAGIYLDYLSMRQQLGYDLNNSVYAYPKDVENAHHKMVVEQNKVEIDRRCQEANRKYELIKKMYRKLRNKYYFEKDGFVIRPAREAGEIVAEGRELHHCVGGNDYLQKHNDGKSIILFLRTVEKPDIPYITVEIAGTRIRQWYGAYDKKPEEVRIDAWLNEYTDMLNDKGKVARMEAV